MERPIKLLYINHHGTAGGATRSLTYLIESFPPGSVDVHILTPGGSAADVFGSVSSDVVEVGELPEVTSIAGASHPTLRLIKTAMDLRSLLRLSKEIRRVDPDIVHLNDVSLGLVARLAKRQGYKVVMHARVVLNDNATLVNRIIKYFVRRFVDRVVAIDGSVANKLAGISQVSIVYNPLHVTDASEVGTRSGGKKCVVLFLANLIKYKGLFDLLEAAQMLKSEEGVQIYIAGANSRPPAFFKTIKGRVLQALGLVLDNEKKVNQIVRNNELTNVSFLGHVKDINEWFRKTDVLVFPSHMNGPSRSVFEAGALGVPSIVAMKDNVQDVVKHGKNGLIIPEKSPRQLAEAIRLLANDAGLRARMSEESRRHYKALNDRSASAQAVLAIYRALVS